MAMSKINESQVFAQSQQANLESAVQEIGELSDRALYGYDSFDARNTTMNSRTHNAMAVPRVVKILTEARGPDIIHLCGAFLSRFGYKNVNMSDRNAFFSGSTSDAVTPHEMKYAVLMLLGINTYGAGNFGYNRPNSLMLSPAYKLIVDEVQEKRRLFPLKNPEKFPKVKVALDKVREFERFSTIEVENIFTKGRIPPEDYLQTSDNKFELPLDAILSILSLSLEGKTDGEIAGQMQKLMSPTIVDTDVEKLLTGSNSSPFTSAVLGLVKTAREEREKPKKQRA